MIVAVLLQDLLVLRALAVRLVLLVTLEDLDLQVRVDFKVQLEQLDILGHLDHLDHEDFRGLPDLPEAKVNSY